MADNHSLARREFLWKTAAMTPVSVLVLGELAQGARRPRSARTAKTLDVATVKQTEFTKLVGSRFTVSNAERTFTLELVDVRPLKNAGDRARPKDVRRDPFSLLFVASNFNSLKAAIYKFQHDKLGTFEVFLSEVRVGDDSAMRHYEVIFN